LVGGFVEEHESWQQGAARELREEAGVTIDPTTLEPLWYASSEPKPNRVLLFSLAPALVASDLPAFRASSEASERGIIFGSIGLEDALAFPLHVEAVRRWFRERRVDGPSDFTAR
jgi:8-oxo-dGTP diphosphatase